MKTKFASKLLIMLLFSILISTLFITINSFAGDMPKFVSPTENPDAYNPTSHISQNNSATIKMIAIIIKWIRNIGAIVGVLIMTIIGFNYMLAGAAEEKAKYKETLIPVAIGVIMLLGVLSLISMVMNLF